MNGDKVVLDTNVNFVNIFFIKQTPKKLIKVSLGNISNVQLIQIFKTQTQDILNLQPYTHFFVELGLDGISTIVD